MLRYHYFYYDSTYVLIIPFVAKKRMHDAVR